MYRGTNKEFAKNIKRGRDIMMRDRDYESFCDHKEWFNKLPSGYFAPTDNTPDEIIKAIERCNARIKRDIENNTNHI